MENNTILINGIEYDYIPNQFIQKMGLRAAQTGRVTDGYVKQGCDSFPEPNLHYEEYDTVRGSFEISFMGIVLYSKIISNKWPKN